jgi:hypothetical protein
MRIHGEKHVASENKLFKWFYHTESNNIPVVSSISIVKHNYNWILLPLTIELLGD